MKRANIHIMIIVNLLKVQIVTAAAATTTTVKHHPKLKILKKRLILTN